MLGREVVEPRLGASQQLQEGDQQAVVRRHLAVAVLHQGFEGLGAA